ncbi:MAG: hypothetical protein ACJA1A_000523 [Saprospiraceae bacterium]|jgi:uncharacterized protein YqgV (UPF0045/DUF77 family)|tara:strand:+ start:1035 stop:1304 length:270 start_codon:yes stop_codon:yes gene_type:complete
MKITVEMSLYPLSEDYTEHIIKFIKSMKSYATLLVRTTAMSTYISGEYKDVMNMLNIELEQLYQNVPDSCTVFKIIPKDLNVESGFLDF